MNPPPTEPQVSMRKDETEFALNLLCVNCSAEKSSRGVGRTDDLLWDAPKSEFGSCATAEIPLCAQYPGILGLRAAG